jgi:transmembrane sensor
MDRKLVALGQEIAEYQDTLIRERLELPTGRARLLSAFAQPHAPRSVLRVLAIAALLVGAAAVGFVLRGPLPGFHVGGGTQAGTTGEWIAAPSNDSVPLSFGDGTRLVLQANGRARVTEVNSNGATVVVERGELRALVHPRPGNRWHIDVGPFRVTVVGTEFDVSWQPDIERFSLTLRRGKVTVAGPVVGVERSVQAGEQLDVWVAQERLTSTPAENSPSPQPAPSGLPLKPFASPSIPSGATPSEFHTPEDVGIATARSRSIEQVRSLAHANRYRDALAEAEQLGFDALCEDASATDVLLLGDVARLAGNVARAKRAYLALRHRFVGGPAAHGAFMLGRIAHDQASAYAEAAEYFATYLREAPAGALAREAASRLVEARLHAGDREAAKAAAVRYLDLYPSGPYAERAKEVLNAP